jgi:hypothetical protein
LSARNPVASPRPLARLAERVALALSATLPLLVLSLHELWTMRVPAVVPSDGGIAEIATRSALHLRRFVGPYSRLRWDHPGPTIYYWFAPFFAASNEYHGGLSAASAVLNLLCAAAIVGVVQRAAGRRAALASAAALLLFVALAGVERWRSLWNPDLVILPVAVALVAAAALVAGKRWALPLLVVAASFSVQTHVGTAPVVAVVTVMATATAAILYRREARRWVGAVAGGAVAAVVLWALPVYQQLTHAPGNLGAIWSYFRHSSAPPQSLHDVTRYVVLQTTLAGVPPRYIGALEGPLPHASWPRVAVAVAVLAVVSAGFVAAVRRGDRFHAGLRGLVLVSIPAAAYAVRNVDGQLFPYLTTFTLAIGLCAWIAALSTVAEVLVPFALRSRSARVVATCRAAGVGLLAVASLLVAVSWRHVRPVAPQVDNPAITNLAEAIKPRVDKRQPLLVSFWVNDVWLLGSGLIDTLERQGYTVDVNSERVFMFGQDHAPDPRDAHRFVLTLAAAQWPVPAAFERVPVQLPDWAPKIEVYEVPPGTALPPAH